MFILESIAAPPRQWGKRDLGTRQDLRQQKLFLNHLRLRFSFLPDAGIL